MSEYLKYGSVNLYILHDKIQEKDHELSNISVSPEQDPQFQRDYSGVGPLNFFYHKL